MDWVWLRLCMAIPFDEAGKIEFITPLFEDQLIVYEKVQLLLSEAIQELSLDINKPINGSDIFFNGDSQKWVKVANTLKGRFYMHTKEYEKLIGMHPLVLIVKVTI